MAWTLHEIDFAMIEVLATEEIGESEADITVVPTGSGMLKESLATAEGKTGKTAPPPPAR